MNTHPFQAFASLAPCGFWVLSIVIPLIWSMWTAHRLHRPGHDWIRFFPTRFFVVFFAMVILQSIAVALSGPAK